MWRFLELLTWTFMVSPVTKLSWEPRSALTYTGLDVSGLPDIQAIPQYVGQVDLDFPPAIQSDLFWTDWQHMNQWACNLDPGYDVERNKGEGQVCLVDEGGCDHRTDKCCTTVSEDLLGAVWWSYPCADVTSFRRPSPASRSFMMSENHGRPEIFTLRKESLRSATAPCNT